MVVYRGHDVLQRFVACQGTTACREIRGDARLPLRCIGVARQAPVLCAASIGADCTAAISPAQQEAFRRLYAHWLEQEFHCAHAVFHHLEDTIPVSEDLLTGASGFMGGTVFTAMTCSALTAGVMVLGLMLAEIENSHLRVMRMIGTMAIRGDAFNDNLNAFSKIMNLGNRLAQWFTAEFGSTQCGAITQCDFSTTEGVQRYIHAGGTARCGLAQMFVTIVGGQAFPLEIFPGYAISSSFQDGIVNGYSPVIGEFALGFGGTSLAFLITVVAVHVLRFLPQDDFASLKAED